MPDTPELDKMLEAKPDSQIIGEFLNWLFNEQHAQMCRFDDKFDEFVPIFESVERWLALYFGIDLEKMEQERRAILDKFNQTA